MYESPISDIYNILGNAVDGSAGAIPPSEDHLPSDEFD